MENNKVVIFDVYKTLLDITTNENEIKTYEFIANWLGYKGLSIKPQHLFDLYKTITKEEYESNKEPYPDIDVGDVFRRILFQIDSAKTEIEDETIKEISRMFRILTTESLIVLPDTKFVLEELFKNVRLAIVSNTQRLFTMGELLKYDIAKYFGYILFSSDVKACKPNPKIFLKALKDLKIEPQNAIYVGDNMFDDIWGAREVGLKTIWINHGKAYKFPEKLTIPKPDAEVKFSEYSKLTEVILSML